MTIEGDVTTRDMTIGTDAAKVFAGSGLTIFLGRGPAKLDNGQLNPLAVGALITNARVGLIQIGSTYAVYATGTASLVGLNGLTITGTFTLLYNDTGKALNQLIDIPGSTDPGVLVNVPIGARSFKATGAQLAVLGQSISGDFEIKTAADGSFTVTASNVNIALGPVHLNGAGGDLTLTSTGVSGHINGTPTFDVTGFSFTANLSLSINTTPAAVGDLPAGPYIRFDAKQVGLTIGGTTITGDFSFEQTTAADGSTATAIAASNVTFSVGTVASLSDGHGSLLITPAGVAGSLAGTVALNLPNASLSGSLALSVTPGQDVRIAGTGVTLAIAGQTLTGDFGFETVTDFGSDGAARRQRHGGRHAGPAARGGERQPLARRRTADRRGRQRLADRQGGRHRRRLRRHDRAQRPERRFQRRPACPGQHDRHEGRRDVRARGRARPPQVVDPGFQVAGKGITLNVLGQMLTGDFAVTSTAGVTTVALANVTASFGGGVAHRSRRRAIRASASARPASPARSTSTSRPALPSVQLTGDFKIAVDTTTPSKFVRVEATNAHAEPARRRRSTARSPSRSPAHGAASSRSPDGSLTLAGGLVAVTAINGVLQLASAGIAGRLSAGVSLGAGSPVSLSGTSRSR